MAQTDPVYITFEFRGDIDKEVNKVTLGIKGLRDEAATTYKKLIADSSAAYNAMSAESRKLATTMQENISSLRSLSAMQEQLDRELEAGTISLSGYTQAKAALALQESNLRVVISQGMQQLQQQMATEQEASDSVVALTRKLQQLTEAYSRLSKMDREGSAGKEILEQIQSVDNELQTAQTRLSAYSRTAGTGFNSLQMSIQQVARELPSLTMGANMFFLAISNNLPILVDNINMARREYQAAIKAGQQATPVWKQLLGGIVSWQTALVVGITLLTVYGKEITAWTKSLFGARQSLADALETLEEFQESVAKTSSTTLTQLQRMSAEWEKLGDNIQAKEQYLLKNRTAFEHLGVSIGKVTDAENLFNQGKEAFVASVMARARASAAMTLATEKYNEAIRKQLEVDRMADTQSYAIQGGQFGQTTYVSSENLSKKKAQAEADSLFDEARKVLERGLEYSEEERKSLETANLKTIRTLEQGSVGAIKASIAAKEAALDKLTNKQDYEAALKEIEAEKKKLEAIIGSTGGKVGKEPAPLGSIAYYNELIAKMQKLRDLATTDKDRSAFAEQIKEYEEKVAEMENQIIISGKKIAMETLQSSLEGIKVDVKFDNRNVLEKAFGKFDTSDLDQMQEKIDKELNRPIKEAREGIVLLIDQWDRLSDADQASLLAEECYKVADGISMAAETAELFNEALGSSLATVAQLVGSVGDMAGGIGRIMSGDLIGGASGIIGGITGIVGSFKKRVEENKKILAEYQLNLVETAMKELEYNAILRERLRIQQQIGETSLEYFNRQSLELKNQAGQIEKEYKQVWEKLQQEQYITATHYKHGTWFRKAKTWNDYDSLAGKTYEEMESLYTQDKLTESAKVLFEQLQKLKDEGEDVAGMIDDLNEEMKEAFTGTNTNAIADTILQGFAEGKRSAKDFADDFQKMLNDAVLQGVKMKALEEPLRKWYESFAAASQNGLTAESIASLKAQYDKIIEDAAKQLEQMEQVTGTTIGDVIDRTSTAKGIALMSQDSADELNGNFYALLIYADRTNQGVTNIQGQLVEGLSLLQRIASNTDRLEAIEKDIRQTRSSLQNIENRGLILRKQ